MNIDSTVGASQPQALAETPLALDPNSSTSSGPTAPIWGIALLTVLLVGGLGFGIYKVVKGIGPAQAVAQTSQSMAVVKFKHGSNAGKTFPLNNLPFLIGRDENNDVCLNDPNILNRHAQIYTSNNHYFLMDLGGETFVNGQAVRRSSTPLKPGDVVRLGRSAYFEFGS